MCQGFRLFFLSLNPIGHLLFLLLPRRVSIFVGQERDDFFKSRFKMPNMGLDTVFPLSGDSDSLQAKET